MHATCSADRTLLLSEHSNNDKEETRKNKRRRRRGEGEKQIKGNSNKRKRSRVEEERCRHSPLNLAVTEKRKPRDHATCPSRATIENSYCVSKQFSSLIQQCQHNPIHSNLQDESWRAICSPSKRPLSFPLTKASGSQAPRTKCIVAKSSRFRTRDARRPAFLKLTWLCKDKKCQIPGQYLRIRHSHFPAHPSPFTTTQ